MRYAPRNILYATDLSEQSNLALPHGVAIAKRYGAKLTVCHVMDVAPTAVQEGLFAAVPVPLDAIEEARARAEVEIRSLLRGSSTSWEVRILEGRAAVEIPRLAAEIDADLVIVPTHGRSGWKRALLGSVTDQLVHGLEAPLLTVPPAVPLKIDDFAPNKIVLGCDFSPDSMQAVAHASAIAQEYQAELHLVHVLEPSIYRMLEKNVTELVLRLEEAVRESVGHRLRELLPEEAYDWSRVVTAVLSGTAHAEILRYAKDVGADLIVVGARGHRNLHEFLVGSTTDRILRQAPCPVLTLRKDAARAPERGVRSDLGKTAIGAT
jgi:nucleotide-binding universal stress UspA family protein